MTQCNAHAQSKDKPHENKERMQCSWRHKEQPHGDTKGTSQSSKNESENEKSCKRVPKQKKDPCTSRDLLSSMITNALKRIHFHP
jgi:hypothetical protein